MDARARVRQFIIDNFLFEDNGSLTADMSFLENGIIDSTGVLELIAFLEGDFGIKVEDGDIVPENLDSLDRVAAFLERKLKPDEAAFPPEGAYEQGLVLTTAR
jgi:acyl carrier protein